MPQTSLEMVEEFKAFIHYAEELNELEEELWNRPIAAGKWTVKDILSHIMLWDKYYYEEGIEKIAHDQPLTVKHLDFDRFNAGAREYAETQSRQSIVEQLLHYRMKIIHVLSRLREEDFIKEYADGDGNKFTVRDYLQGFVPHDMHHKKQIDDFIRSAAM
ncbi:DinB family protein [Paenibacillus hamazuiensis]|uniref:DinB family protein n=1 Tax=Paenibacillus hamazuiensis TaxID=2936508 RepID=UPI00200DA33D|nr:DinB family protein [Paenibacillus hamazuiensis]